jgi:seryl-tRNA synthetase
MSMVRDGVFFPTRKVGDLEARIFKSLTKTLKHNGFRYLSVPSTITRDTIDRQGVVAWENIIRLSDTHGLAGSAEQGILEMFKGQRVGQGKPELRLFADNQCFRNEETYVGLKYLREFRKLEQFVFCGKANWKENFQLVLSMAEGLLCQYDIKYRVVDVTKRDHGYHVLKKDIEVLTTTYGWMETHSCTYFGDEQTKRFGITGLTHTISCTGVASPRILVPLLERAGILF